MRTSPLLGRTRAGLAALLVPLSFACGGGAPRAADPATANSTASTASTASTKTPAGSASTPSAPSPAADDGDPEAGGECTYAKHRGVCVVTANATFTFQGSVEGVNVLLPGNLLVTAGKPPPVGTSTPCTLDFLTEGICSPCMFSNGGSCGEPALLVFDAARQKK
jgi:hypothetical protein